VRGFLRRHQKIAHLFEAAQECAIQKPGETRFATNCISMRDVYKNKAAILFIFNSNELQEYVQLNRSTKNKHGVTLQTTFDEAMRIVSDNSFWKKLMWALKAMEPVERLLRLAEIDGPTLSKMHQKWLNMFVEFGNLEEQGAEKQFVDEMIECAHYLARNR
jgi:hypothetical protein